MGGAACQILRRSRRDRVEESGSTDMTEFPEAAPGLTNLDALPRKLGRRHYLAAGPLIRASSWLGNGSTEAR